MKDIKYNSKIISFFKKQNIQVVLLTIVGLLGLLSWVIPISELFAEKILNNNLLSGLICLCGVVLTLILIISIFKNGKKNKKYYIDLLYVSPLVFIEIISVLILFQNALWGYKAIVLLAALSWLLIVGIIIGIATLFNKVFNKEIIPVILIALSVVILVFSIACAKIGERECSEFFYKVSGAIIYLIAIAIYANKYIYSQKCENKLITNIIGIVFWGAIIIISFPYYVQWCGLNGNNLATFVSIYAAVISGGITLAGVAWTIKDTHDKSKEDIKRIENEQKEEERKRSIPYIKSVLNVIYDENENVTIKNKYDYSKPEHRAAFTDNNVYSIQIGEFGVKNISDTNIIFYEICINDEYYRFEEFILEKNKSCKITINNNNWITSPKQLSSIKLIVRDMIGNNYSILCKFSLNRNVPPESGDEITDDGISYKIHARSYVVSKVSLPEYFEEE